MFKYLLLLIFILPAGLNQLHSQELSPKSQLLLDSLNNWMQKELQTKGTIDTDTLEKFNREIREEEAKSHSAASEAPEKGQAKASKTITKEVMGGGELIVPEGVEWKIAGVYVKDDKSEYKIRIQSVTYDKIYKPGEKISAPGYASELALLDNEDATEVTYTFEIVETKLP